MEVTTQLQHERERTTVGENEGGIRRLYHAALAAGWFLIDSDFANFALFSDDWGLGANLSLVINPGSIRIRTIGGDAEVEIREFERFPPPAAFREVLKAMEA